MQGKREVTREAAAEGLPSMPRLCQLQWHFDRGETLWAVLDNQLALRFPDVEALTSAA